MYPFVDERLPLSVNGLERCELNIDFIRSLVAVAVAVRSADSPVRWSRRNLLEE